MTFAQTLISLKAAETAELATVRFCWPLLGKIEFFGRFFSQDYAALWPGKSTCCQVKSLARLNDIKIIKLWTAGLDSRLGCHRLPCAYARQESGEDPRADKRPRVWSQEHCRSAEHKLCSYFCALEQCLKGKFRQFLWNSAVRSWQYSPSVGSLKHDESTES